MKNVYVVGDDDLYHPPTLNRTLASAKDFYRFEGELNWEALGGCCAGSTC